MQEKKIKVTTTSGFENVEIIEYLEPISAHIVVGMNIFKDFFGGITDIFGGNSSTYENTLASINQSVINQLRKKAYSTGANSVVGLKIDNDEIGAKGKSMMMVTATGTAVIAKFPEKSLELEKDKKLNNISNETFEILYQRKKYIDKSLNNTLRVNGEFWSFVKKHKVGELADFVVEHFEKSALELQDFQLETLNKLKNHTIEYYTSIDYNIAVESLYKKLNSDLNLKVRNHISEIIIKSNLIDYDKILNLIENSDFLTQKNGIQICSNNKINYDSTDIHKIQKIANFIDSNFKERGEKTTKKKMLSSKEIDIWICECGKENNGFDEICSKCKNDIFGFNENDTKPKELSIVLNDKIEILGKILK
ncbi:YbjQ family protein [uncultured Lutibacter sp.]|uniref:YbjQ family protein n=1 Tax=uncultured Lutibacter sp. TaxID=437739 RepID=UPI002606E18C|nr:YbjQ family protein [uncultured Lutibacter sp.]